jgi:hypothetical protein
VSRWGTGLRDAIQNRHAASLEGADIRWPVCHFL